MKRRRRKYESTAYHEAGHAVVAFLLRLKIGGRGVTIVPDKERDMKEATIHGSWVMQLGVESARRSPLVEAHEKKRSRELMRLILGASRSDTGRQPLSSVGSLPR